jgi:hypothetical protein
MQDFNTSAHASPMLSRAFLTLKIPPESFHRKLVFAIGCVLNQLGKCLLKTKTLKSGNNTLIHWLNKKYGVWRQDHYITVLINIRNMSGVFRSIIQEDEPSIHEGVHWQGKKLAVIQAFLLDCHTTDKTPENNIVFKHPVALL